MDTAQIFVLTSKGLVELKAGAVQLSPLQSQALGMIDGASSVAQLAARLGDSDAAEQLPLALAELERRELIAPKSDADDALAAPPVIEVVELSPEESVQAWAEARRGAQELQEKGYYSPPAKLHQASHQAGANVNRVLVVEDDATTAKILEFLLHEHDFQVATADSGAAALAELAKQPLPDVVLLDVMLPDGDGFDILRHIRASASLAQVPVIMVTARISDEDVMRGLKEGADGYVFKPFKWETLYACIKNVL